jgi:diguanylate cyclase (GGDEF)-like protein
LPPLIVKNLIRRCARTVALLCVCAPCFAVAPSPNSQFVGKLAEDGATVGAVNVVFQDHEGYIWLGGTDGLARYDGYRFEVFHNDAADQSSISSNAVWSIAEDGSGELWIATDAGLNRFDRDRKRFLRFQQQQGKRGSLVSNTVRSLVRDRTGTLWIGTYGGLARLNPDHASFTTFTHGDDNANRIRAVLVDSRGALWLGTDGGGLNRFDPATRAVHVYVNEPGKPDSLSHNVVTSIVEDHSHRLWLGTGGGGVNRFDPGSGKFVHYAHDEHQADSLLDNNAATVMEDRDGAIWVGTPLGADVLQPGASGFVHLRADQQGQRNLPSGNVRSVFQDNNGDMWIGTFPNGISYLNTGTLAFHSYGKGQAGSGLSHESVLALHEDRTGDLWLGTDGGGLDRLDARTGRMSYYRHDPALPGSVSANVILSIAEDKQGVLWLGTWEGGVNRLDPATGQAKAYFVDYNVPTTVSSNNTWTVFNDDHDQLWVGTVGGGLNRYDKDQDRFTRFSPDPKDGASLGSPLVWAIEPDLQDRLWLGTGDGVDLLDRASGKFSHYKHRANDPASVSADTVLAVHQGAHGEVWLGTRGGGLDRLDPASGRIRRYDRKDGLPSDVVASIEEDAKGRLWLGTHNGLVEFDPASGHARTFGRSDGVQGNQFNIGAALRLRSGELVFGGTQGYTRFFPDQVTHNRYRPPVVFRDFQIFNKSVSIDAPGSPLHKVIEHTRDITLNYHQSVFSIEYAALGYRNPDKNRYAYRLVGFDRDWNEVGSRRSATYTNLDAGDYRFEVRAANDEGLWSERPATLRIHVLPPPWQTWWAYTLYALLVAAAAGAFVRSQRKKVRQQLEINRMLENKVAERTRELAVKNADLERINQKLEDISLSDPLTGLNNRRYLSKCIGADSAMAVRAYQRRAEPALAQGEQDLLFFIMDLDHFKSVNDTYGHGNGDAVLVQMASILRQVCREADMVLRWGGEEFLVVSRFTDRAQAPQIAERLRAAVEQHVFELDQGRTLRKTCSIGFACFPFDRAAPEDVTVEQVIDIADRCLYQVKRHQRNGWMGMYLADGSALGFAELVAQPQRAIDAGQVVLKTSIDAAFEWADGAPH